MLGNYSTCMVDGVSSSCDMACPYHSEAWRISAAVLERWTRDIASATYFRFLQVMQERTARGFRCSRGGSTGNAAVSDGVLLGGVSILKIDVEVTPEYQELAFVSWHEKCSCQTHSLLLLAFRPHEHPQTFSTSGMTAKSPDDISETCCSQALATIRVRLPKELRANFR